MIFYDEWTEGLTQQQQNLVVSYVLNECRLPPDLCGYSSKTTARNFLESERGRKATRKYCEFFLDTKKDTVKLRLIRIHLERAFFNPADILDKEGKFVLEQKEDLKKLGDLAYCIEGIKTKYNSDGDKEIEIKLCDRNKSMEFIVKAFRLFDEETGIDELTGEKSIFDMSDEERIDAIINLLQSNKVEIAKVLKLPAPEENKE